MSTITLVQNYQGSNSFIVKMKETIKKYGSLTSKQASAVEKILTAPVEAKQVELTDDMKKIQSYAGENSFVKDIQSKLEKYGKLSDKQVTAAVSQIKKEETKTATKEMNIPTEGDTIQVGRRIGQQMKETYGLEFNPTILDITKVIAISPKAVKFEGKMTVKRCKVCMCCAKSLTDEFSMLTQMGKTCAKHMKVEYIKDKSQAARFREEYLKRVEEIGTMEFWVPKSQLKNWEGSSSHLLENF
jgi:flagellar biosynthesis chaperone FliJ